MRVSNCVWLLVLVIAVMSVLGFCHENLVTSTGSQAPFEVGVTTMQEIEASFGEAPSFTVRPGDPDGFRKRGDWMARLEYEEWILYFNADGILIKASPR